MMRQDYQIIFTALGFLAVILRDDVPQDKQALRATSIARLIESFCVTEVPDAFSEECIAHNTTVSSVEPLLEHYIAELRDNGSADSSFDRKTLLQMYELLTIQKMRHEQNELYTAGHDDLIAQIVFQMAADKISREG
ncbi:MAG: hypothetical protein P4N59_05510 [Negativicutes bacterium]|nr:hypothetical protein [Negativicutes bacterium]